MEEYTMERYSKLMMVLALALCACTRLPEDDPEKECPAWETTPVSISLAVDGYSNEQATKLTPVNEPDSHVSIQNVWLLQFDGEGDNAVLARDPIYLASYTPSAQVPLRTDLAGNSTLVFVANTFQNLLNMGTVEQTTLGDFKKKFMPVRGEESLFGVSGSNYYQRLNGYCVQPINKNTTALASTVNLKRSVARLDVYVKNTTSTNALTVTGIQVCSVPRQDFLFTNRSVALTAPFPLDIMETVDYPIVPEASMLGAWGDTDGKHYTTYVPMNLRGTGTGTDPKYKDKEAPYGATYLKVIATETATSNPVVFVFFLGNDFGGEKGVVDYNLQPNHKYTYKLTISDSWKTNAATDGRISYLPLETDFTTVAERPNSYMLRVGGADIDKTYSFMIPVEKSDLFWAHETYRKKAYDSENDIFVRYLSGDKTAENMILGTTRNWEAEILWSDFDITKGGKVTLDNEHKSGTGIGESGNNYFTVKVKSGVQGNVVVALKVDIDGNGTVDDAYSWSWHLWITDYNPDQTYTAPAGKLVYRVAGGRLIRYGATDPFMMDRPLGATYDPMRPDFRKVNSTASRADTTMGLYYQFGRKDPFPNARPIYVKGGTSPVTSIQEITTSNASSALEKGFTRVQRTSLSSGNNVLKTDGALTVPFAISHPMTFIMSSSGLTWNQGVSGKEDCFNPSSNVTSIIWMDPAANGRVSAPKYGNNKSVFDPCPAGWKLPTDVSASGNWKTTAGKTDAIYLSPMENSYYYGSYLWPAGVPGTITESSMDQADLYAYEGYISYAAGTLNAYLNEPLSAKQAHAWTSHPLSTTQALAMNLEPGKFDGGIGYHAQGYVVRCVKQ